MSTENISEDVIWQIVRKQNAYLVKRKGYGGVQFSSDPYNLKNHHSRKHAGFVNNKAIGITADSPNTVGLTTKVSGRPHQPAKSQHQSSFSSNTGSRKIYRSVVNSTAKRGYRSDLNADAVARASAIKNSQREKKEITQKRGAKRSKTAEKESS